MAKHTHLRAALARARAGGASAAKGAKGSAIAVVVGAASNALYSLAADKVQFVRETWWAGPVGFAVAGHFVKRKHHDAGTAMLAIGGFTGLQNYRMSQNQPPPAQPGAKGYDQLDAGALDSAFAALNPGDAGAIDGGEAGALVYDQLGAGGLQERGAMGLEDAGAVYDDAGDLDG